MYKAVALAVLLLVGCETTVQKPKTYTVYTPFTTYTGTVRDRQSFSSDYAYFYLPDGREVVISKPYVIEEEPCTK